MKIIKLIASHFFFFALLLNTDYAFAQEFIEADLKKINIPLLVISTDDGLEPQGYRIDHPEGCVGIGLTGNEYKTGRMVMTLMDSVIYDSGEYLASSSGIRVRLRGNTSAIAWEKKPYKLKLSKKFDFFQRGDKKYNSKDWVLLCCPKIELNTVFGFKVNEMLGLEWTPKIQYVNVILNGDYKGLYILCESIEQGEGRCNVSKNGFIVEDDAYWWNEEVYFKGGVLPYSMGYTFKHPDTDDIDTEYLLRITDYFLEVERRLESSEDVSEYIDFNSFAAWLLGHDILGTEDAAGSNRYIYKYDFIQDDITHSQLKMGPIWDFDDIFRREGKWSQQHSGNYRYYFRYLLGYPEFIDEFVRLWNSVKDTFYDDMMDYLYSFEQDYGETLDICRGLDSKRWGRVRYNLVADDVRIIDEWMSARLEWIDEQLMKETSVNAVKEEQSNSCIYTLDGRKVLSDAKEMIPSGIYIKDGRKYIVR